MFKKAFGLLALIGIGFLAYQSFKEMKNKNKPKLKKDLE
jgi:hypothetical protein